MGQKAPGQDAPGKGCTNKIAYSHHRGFAQVVYRALRISVSKWIAVTVGLAMTGANAFSAQITLNPAALYAEGNYEAAIQAGVARNDATDLVIASQAALTDASLRDFPCMDCLRRAESYARRAVAADPRLADAHTDIALALAFEARVTGPFVARLNGVPGAIKSELDTALADDPNSAPALAALGGWNFGVVQAGGTVLARMMYGATAKQGFALFARAMAAAPDDLPTRYQYALTLGGYDPKAYRSQIEAAFGSVGALSPVTAYEKVLQERAAELLALLRSDDLLRFRARVRRYQGYP